MSPLHPYRWATKNAAILSVSGALIVFFSWAVTNAYVQRHTRLKQSVEIAQGTFRLYTTLHQLRDMVNSIAMEVVQQKTGADASMVASGRTGNTAIDGVRRQFDLARLSAHQIKELGDFSAETYSFSRAVGSETPAAHDIDVVSKEIDGLAQALRELENDAERAVNDPNATLEQQREAVGRYVEFVREKAIPQVAPLYERIAELSNMRNDEGRRELALAKDRAEESSQIATILYVFGSILAVGGQYFDKIAKNKAKLAPAA